MDIRKKIINDLEERINKISKLNEELTAENSKLITERDKFKSKSDYMTMRRNAEREDKNSWRELYHSKDDELSSIKSKWWYRLFKNW